MARTTGRAIELILKSQLVLLHDAAARTAEGPEKELIIAAEMEVDMFLQEKTAPPVRGPKKTRARRKRPEPYSVF